MSLLRFEDIGLEFGDQLILRNAEFSIDAGERVCLIGRNGAGKSTTLKLIMGTLEADRGEIIAKQDLIVSQLDQTLPEAMASTGCGNSKHCMRKSMRTTAGISSSASRRQSPN